MECSNCGKLNQTITNLERKNDNLIQGHDRLTKTNEQLRKEIKLYQKDQK